MSHPRPRLVKPSAEQPVDITALNRAAIEARDWDAAMVWGDKQKPVSLPERTRKAWGWR